MSGAESRLAVILWRHELSGTSQIFLVRYVRVAPAPQARGLTRKDSWTTAPNLYRLGFAKAQGVCREVQEKAAVSSSCQGAAWGKFSFVSNDA